MGKSEQTLFEKLETELEKETEEELSTSGEGWRYMRRVRIAIIAATTFCVTLFFPLNRSLYQQLSVGAEWQQESLVAETNFPIYKPKVQYEKDVQAAREQTVPVFVPSAEGEAVLLALKSIEQSITSGEAADPAQMQRVTGFSAENLARLFALPEARRDKKVLHIVERCTALQTMVYKQGFIDIALSVLKGQEIIVRRSATVEEVLPVSQFYDSALYRTAFEQMLRQDFDDLERALASDLLPKLTHQNITFSPAFTEVARRLAAESVPKTLGMVRRGETIIAKGETLSAMALNKLRSSEFTRFLYYSEYQSLGSFAANLLHAALIYSLLLVYLYIIRKRLFYDNAQLAGLSAAFVVSGFLSWLVSIIQSPLPLQYFVMIPALSMLIAIVYDSRTTSIATIAMALLSAAIRGRDYEIALAMVVAGTFAGYTVRDLRSRTQLFKSISFIILGYSAAAAMFALKYSTPIGVLGLQISFAALSAVLSPIFTFGVLYLLERMFNITSDLRLLEYDNVNHPLLVELNEKAPGTYQHTLMVARLAESAALAIDANPILVKVGALFHDIGKVRKAEYFVENQINIANKHDKIAPHKSAAIIRQHVQEGLQLATFYKLPQRIIDFIPMHHGTMLIRYFYVKALDEAAEKSTPEKQVTVDVDDFRYPGPRPNSKETGILMLADAVEAVSHVIDTNDRDELEEAIDKIFEERFTDKQLEECDLTMREMAVIRESFVKNLLGTGHQRVKYKPIPKDGKEKEEEHHRDEVGDAAE